MNHSLFENLDGSAFCSCGQFFRSKLSALSHALPLGIAALDAEVQADPNSSPELRSKTAALLDDVQRNGL